MSSTGRTSMSIYLLKACLPVRRRQAPPCNILVNGACTLAIISDGTFGIVAALSILASVVGLWSLFRRRQIMRRLLRSLSEEQLKKLGIDVSETRDSDSR